MTTLDWRDSSGVTHKLQEEPGDGGGLEKRPVHGLPAAVVADIAATASRLTTIITSLTSILSAVDGLEGYTDTLETLIGSTNTALTTLQGYTDGLEGLVGTTNTALTALQGYVDQLEGYTDTLETLIGSTNTKLDTLHSDLATVATAAFKVDQKTNITTSDAQFTTRALTKGLQVKNASTNGNLLYVSHASSVSTTTSLILLPGEWSPFLECTNADQVYMRGSAASTVACYAGQ